MDNGSQTNHGHWKPDTRRRQDRVGEGEKAQENLSLRRRERLMGPQGTIGDGLVVKPECLGSKKGLDLRMEYGDKSGN